MTKNLARAALFALVQTLACGQAHSLENVQSDILLSALGPTVTGISPSSGPATGGTSVTITGTNLVGVTGVRFGSRFASSVTVNSSTQITAVSPAMDAGTVADVVIHAAAGTSVANAADQYTNLPVLQQAPIVAARKIATGESHTCAVTDKGGVKCWGGNVYGQLGDGTASDRWAAVDVAGLVSGVSAIAAGRNHTCVLTNAGGVKCWGSNAYGQLGDGSMSDRWTAVEVAGLSSGVKAITAGYSHTCALTSVGGVKCWGNNGDGQLGDGTTVWRLTPADVTGLMWDASAVAAGGSHTCAVTGAGGVKCWGDNRFGQLGDGTVNSRPVAADVTGLASGVSSITAGYRHACVLLSAGGVKCWGANLDGQLGNGTTTAAELKAVDVTGLNSSVSAIAAGNSHTCALTGAGGVKCWGWNEFGQLGDGTNGNQPAATDVAGLSSGVTALAAGGMHSCAVTNAGGVRCWGDIDNGRLGDGAASNRLKVVDVIGSTPATSAIAAGVGHTCVLNGAGGVACWGTNGFGQLGDGTTNNRWTAADVAGLTSGVGAIAAGTGHACAVTGGGAVKCWGRNASGQLGDGTTGNRSTPVAAAGLATGVKAVAAGDGHSCALMNTGGVKCWGDNSAGQVGDGTLTQRLTAVDVTGLAAGVSAIAAGASHTCALTGAGGVACWGDNGYGQLGDGSTAQRSTAVSVAGLTAGVTAIAAGAFHTCALMNTGGVKCWGGNDGGQLGDGSPTARPTAADVPGLTSGAGAIAAGAFHTCALMTTGGVKCWGDNSAGQIGDGTLTQRLTAVDVAGMSSGISALAAGYYYTYARTSAGGAKCWGYNGGRLCNGWVAGTSNFAAVALQAAPGVASVSPNHGSRFGGTPVLITGTNFGDAGAVKFGSVDAVSFAINSSTQITATAPAGLVGMIDISVTSPGGTSSAGAADQFTYDAPPPPTVGSTVVEFVDTQDFPNTPGGHYFYSADTGEQVWIDGGGAGKFLRTGRTFPSGGDVPVCRFFGSVSPGPNSHFFTVSDSECKALKAAQITPPPVAAPQWNFEGYGFSSGAPTVDASGQAGCMAGTVPVYRAYNNAYPKSGGKNPWDSNHRFSTRRSDIDQMVALGWVAEGIVMCAPAQ